MGNDQTKPPEEKENPANQFEIDQLAAMDDHQLLAMSVDEHQNILLAEVIERRVSAKEAII